MCVFATWKTKGRIAMKIDWKTKLSSRKFWAAVVGFVTAVLAVFGLGENEVAQIVAIITAGATLIAYIIGEGLVDAAAAQNKTPETTETGTTPEIPAATEEKTE